MADQKIGKVVHYYDKAMVAVVKLLDELKVGDKIKVVKGDKDFEMKICSMQIDRKPVEECREGGEVAIKVDSPAKEGATVLKLAEE